MKRLLIAALLVSAAPAFAQQQPADLALLQRTLGQMQAQRNQGFDALAVAEARLAIATDDLAKAQARIKDMEPKPEEPSK